MPTRLHEIGGTVLASNIALPELLPARAARPEVAFELLPAGVPQEEPEQWIRRWDLPDEEGRPWALFARVGGEWLIRFPSHGDFRLSSDRRRILCRPLPGIPAATVRHLLLDQVLPLALRHGGRFVLHASAVALAEQAIGIVGQSGSGKSTLAASLAGAGAELLSDDCLVAEERDGEWQVEPYYAGLRLWPDNAAELGVPRSQAVEVAHYTRKLRIDQRGGLPFRRSSTPLRGLFILSEEGDAVSTRRLSAREAHVALVEAAYLLDPGDATALKEQFETVGRIAAAVPCHILCYPYRYEVLGRVRDAILDCLDLTRPTGRPCTTETPG
jgi:hypothetical protein